ncbi:hypothetical protein NXT3_PB00144 (plasmid) [Sinorhizobium fredii]|uniref:Uncharacterized protein n=1 Tax=Rhizobium fredii TaxID=380 RepID=A0A2L0HBG6_RHIFR|nr:hypothetical protein NXT3_PB00144 [Sinorhizobium fredii]
MEAHCGTLSTMCRQVLLIAAFVFSAAIDDSWLVDHVSEPKAPMFDETFVSIAPIHL